MSCDRDKIPLVFVEKTRHGGDLLEFASYAARSEKIAMMKAAQVL
jgi:hypothetical protein